MTFKKPSLPSEVSKLSQNYVGMLVSPLGVKTTGVHVVSLHSPWLRLGCQCASHALIQPGVCYI